MRSILLSLVATTSLVSAAAAADAVVYGEAPAPAMEQAVYDWSGAYVGVFAGVTTGDYDFTATDGTDSLGLSLSGSGFLGGAQIGYDWQVGSYVFGAVADIAATNHEADITATVSGFGSARAESTLKYLGTLRGRFGYAMDEFLVYGHGGLAYGETEQTISVDGLGSISTDNDTKVGWTIGAGAEYALTQNVSFQTEYAFTDLGEDTLFNEGGIAINEDVSFHAIKVGLNFRF